MNYNGIILLNINHNCLNRLIVLFLINVDKNNCAIRQICKQSVDYYYKNTIFC